MKKTTYKNRYNDTFTFTPNEDGNLIWEGDFEYHRYGWPNNPDGTPNKDIIDMVDPSGGPYLTAGRKIQGKTIQEFKRLEENKYLIILK
jgi:hypothetical protein